MKAFTKLLAVAAVGLGLTGTASASDPVKKGGIIVHGGVSQGVIVPPVVVPHGGVKVLPYPYPTNPGPFPPVITPRPLPVVVPPRVDIDYVVVYKASIFSPVRTYGKFETLNGARFAALQLESFGYPVKIVPVRDFHPGWAW